MLPILALLAFPQPAPFTPEFGLVPGERYEFRVARSRAQTGRPTVHTEATQSIEFLHVDPSTKDRFVLRSTTDATGNVADADLASIGLTPEDLRVTLDMVFDGYLQFYAAPGWRRTRDAMLEVTDRISDTRVRAGQMSPEQADKARELALAMCGTEDAVLLLGLKNVWPWFSGYTHWDVTADAQEYEDVMPGALGDMDLPALSSVRLDDDPETPETIEFRFEQRVDPDATAAYIEALMARLGPEGAAAPAPIESIDVVDTIVWSYNPETALIERTVHDRRVTSGGQFRRERTEWILVEVGAASPPRFPPGKGAPAGN